jgi:ATP-dependent protease HslVU (ClpYQ) ATPase subunit
MIVAFQRAKLWQTKAHTEISETSFGQHLFGDRGTEHFLVVVCPAFRVAEFVDGLPVLQGRYAGR